VLALGACAGDDDDDASGGDTGTEADESDADAAAFCDAIVDADWATLAVSIGEGDAASAEAALVAAEEAAPEEIGADVQTMAEELRAQVAAGPQSEDGPPVIPPDDFFAAATSVGDYMADNCGYEVIDVTATDYAFAGIPADAEAGRTLIRITNDGTEYHEVALQRVYGGQTRSVEEILALPEEERDALLDHQGLVFAPPGLGNWIVMDLTAGRHIAGCFIPTGATPEAFQSGQVDDTTPPHTMQGMTAEMQVT
jgi:hypothetical protein